MIFREAPFGDRRIRINDSKHLVGNTERLPAGSHTLQHHRATRKTWIVLRVGREH